MPVTSAPKLEATLHQQVCDYLKLQYSGVLFHSDFGSGIKLTIGQAARQKRLQSGRAWPDLQIAEPRGDKHGLFLELKREGTVIILRNGQLTADKHVREQHAVLKELIERGYAADFAVGFAAARTAIDKYLAS